MDEAVYLCYVFFKRSLYLQKGVFHMTLGCRAGVMRAGEQSGARRTWTLGWLLFCLGLGSGGNNLYFSSFVILPILTDIFTWRTLDRQMLVTPWQEHPELFLQGVEQSPRLSRPFKTPTWGWGLSCFLSQPNGQSPSLQTCFQVSAFSLGYFHFSYITVLQNF